MHANAVNINPCVFRSKVHCDSLPLSTPFPISLWEKCWLWFQCSSLTPHPYSHTHTHSPIPLHITSQCIQWPLREALNGSETAGCRGSSSSILFFWCPPQGVERRVEIRASKQTWALPQTQNDLFSQTQEYRRTHPFFTKKKKKGWPLSGVRLEQPESTAHATY